MVELTKKYSNRKMTSMFILFAVILLFFSSTFGHLIARGEELNSNDYRMSLIDLGRGNQAGYADGLESLTGEQLKTIGVFISNYYVPFSTQVGKGRTPKEDEEIKQQMVDVLTKTGSFTDETARVIVNAVLNVSANPQPLYFGYSTDGGKSYKPAKTNGKEGRQATFYEFLDQISGYAYKTAVGGVEGYPDKSLFDKDKSDSKGSVYNDPNYGYKEGSKQNRGSLYWSESGGANLSPTNVVFDWNPARSEGGGQTASQTVMAEIYRYIDKKNSVGGSFLDYTAEERGGATASSTVSNLVEKMGLQNQDISHIYKRSMYAWTMWVDAFGNILVDTGVRQYVVVPAAMNPYAFKKSGVVLDKDPGGGNPFDYGRAVPVNNLISITLASQNKLLKFNDQYTNDTATLDVGNIHGNFPKGGFGRTFYKFPESGDHSWDETKWGRDWGSSILDALTTQYGFERYGLKRASGLGDWLKLNDSPKNVERYTNNKKLYGGNQDKDSDTLRTMYRYGFNSWVLGENYHITVPRSGLNGNPTHYIIQDLVAFDNMGLDYAKYQEFDGNIDTLKRTSIWNSSGDPIISTEGITEQSAFGQSLKAERNALNTASNEIMRNYSANLYVTYILAGLGGEDKVGFKIGFNRFPTYNSNTFLKELDYTEQQQINNQEVMNLAYYFLHPTEGIQYFARWAKTKIGAMLVGWHNDMTGANSSASTTGLTKYIGFSGFTTMPSLNDMQWTSWMVDTYLSWGIYLIIGVVLIMIFYIAIGEVTIQRAILGVVIFSVCLYLPPTTINSVVGITNSISDNIYSKKFVYWGIAQLQAYSGKVDDLAKAGKDGREADYSRGLMELQNDGMYGSNTNLGNGVTLKWMSPKKDNYLAQIQEDLNEATGGRAGNLNGLTTGLLSRTISGESYLDSSHALYLYRTFSDITNYSRFYYGNLMGDNVYGNGSISHDIGDISQSMSTVGMSQQYNNYIIGTGENSLYERKRKGFINDYENAIAGASSTKKRLKRIYAPLSSQVVAKSANQNIKNATVGTNIGVSSKDFQATIANFNNHTKDLKSQLGSSSSARNLASTSSFALYTESPYYYFSWFLYDNGMSTQGSTDSLRRLFLDDNDKFFYNYSINKDSSGYGELKDYFDMGTLFTAVIPYLRTVNTPLKQWGSIYGVTPYPDVSTSEEDASSYTNKNSESYYKYWFNVSLSKLFNTYTPWVDAMYDANYAKPEKIEYAGKKQTVQDPLNPKSYTVRPMIFSESEMVYYGLKEYNLTKVERKILKVQRDTRHDLLQLLNYYTFDDSVLNSTAAMIMTFNFNKEFSENNFFGESFVQYPQGFELKNFTYDAYLRLILSEGTSESLQASGQASLYDRLVEKSSILTGILLVVGDILSVYLIPVMKFIFLILVFVLSVLTIFVKAMRIEVSFKTVLWDSLAKPLIQFCAVTVGHSLIVSFFMGNGLTGVTGDTSITISLGDPSMTLIVMILINSVTIVLYGLIVFSLIKKLIVYGKLTYGVMEGVLASSFSLASSGVGSLTNSVQDKMFNGSGGSKTPPSSTYSTDPEERGRRNVEPETVVDSELRTRDINVNAYVDDNREAQLRRQAVDIDRMVKEGQKKVNETEVEPVNPALEEKKKHAEDVKKKYDLD